jgi:hypothetical protein
MQSPDAVPCDADATRTAVKDILDCYAVKVASKALARHLLPASGLANPSARRVGSRTRRLGSQTAVFPSHRAIPALVPATVVEPPEHIRYAAGVDHPAAEHGQDLPEDVLVTVSEITRQHAGGYEPAAPRKHAVKALQRAVKLLEPVNAKLDAVLPAHVLGMVQRPNVALLCVLERVVRSPDSELAADMAVGMPVVGDIPPSGWWEVDVKLAAEDITMMDHAEWHDSIERQARSEAARPEKSGDLAAVWDRTMDEVEEGLMHGPFSRAQIDAAYGAGQWRAMRRFGVLQNGKVRGCDNARSSQTNAATTTFEKLGCDGPDFSAKVARAFAAEFEKYGLPVPAMMGGTDDLANAYRHVPSRTPQYTVVMMPGPDGQPAYFTLPGLNFGLSSAVLQFNRFPELMVAVARRLLGVVCTHFYDDYAVVEPAFSAKWGQWALRALHTAVGFPFAPKKAVDVSPRFVFLGVVTDFARVQEGVVLMHVSKERVDKLVALLENLLEEREMPPSVAAHVCGKLAFTLSWTFGRVGRACLQPLFGAHATGFTAGVAASLGYLTRLLPAIPPHTIRLAASAGPPTLLWTDGCYEDPDRNAFATDFECNIGFLVGTPRKGIEWPPPQSPPSAEWVAASYDFVHGAAPVPEELLETLVRRRQQIGQVEIIGAIVPYLSVPKLLAGRDVLHWIDNTSALSALTKGYSGVPDSARLVHMFHAWNVGARAAVWFEYVPSKPNPADEPSRELELAGADWRPAPGVVSRPRACVFPPLERLDDPRGWAREAQGAAACM